MKRKPKSVAASEPGDGEEKPIIWRGTDGTGDLSDDCVCEWNGLIGRAECMGSYIVKEDGPEWEAEYWWGSVYDGEEEIWSTNENGGLIGGSANTASACMRGVVELAMRARFQSDRADAAEKEVARVRREWIPRRGAYRQREMREPPVVATMPAGEGEGKRATA